MDMNDDDPPSDPPPNHRCERQQSIDVNDRVGRDVTRPGKGTIQNNLTD